MADNTTTGTGVPVATRSVTYSGDAAQNVQAVALVTVSGSDDSKTATDLALGQAVMASSLPVAIASNQTAMPVNHAELTAQTGTWDSSTTVDAAVTITCTASAVVSIVLTRTGSISSGTITFERSADGGATWTGSRAVGDSGAIITSLTAASVGTASGVWRIAAAGLTTIRVRLNPVIVGAGSVAIRIVGSAASMNQLVTLQQLSGDTLAVSGTVTASNLTGNVAHDGLDSGSPVKQGAKAIAHGTNPTAVAADDRTDLYANRAGIPFTIGGHPNPVMYGMSITTAVSNTIIGPTISSGLKLVVTSIMALLDNASTVFPSVVIGFGTANTPAFATTPGTSKVIAGHPAVAAGGGFTRGDGSGIIGVGADDEELRITTVGTAGGNGLYVLLTGYTIES